MAAKAELVADALETIVAGEIGAQRPALELDRTIVRFRWRWEVAGDKNDEKKKLYALLGYSCSTSAFGHADKIIAHTQP